VSRAAYYDWKRHRDEIPTVGELAERRLVKEIEAIHDDSDGTYGSPRVTEELRRRGWVVNHKRVERLMRVLSIVGYTPKKKRVTTIPNAEHRIPDRVRGNFAPAAPDMTWCGDISYIPTWEGFLYLAFVEDLASRRILGLSMAGHMRAELVAGALDAAVGVRGGDVAGVVFHSGRGTQLLNAVRRRVRPPPGAAIGRTYRGVLGQRPRRVVPRHPQEGTRPPADLPHQSPSPGRDPALDRSLVQPTTAQLRPRLPIPVRMGGPLPSHHHDHGRITNVSGQRGELQK